MMYVTDENFKALEEEAIKRNLSVQALVRKVIGECLGIKSSIKSFENDVMCPECGSDGEIVEDLKGKRRCLNCGYSRKIGVN
jgi:Zn finger protein HypA/HybF involved in hydrogenase expression